MLTVSGAQTYNCPPVIPATTADTNSQAYPNVLGMARTLRRRRSHKNGARRVGVQKFLTYASIMALVTMSAKEVLASTTRRPLRSLTPPHHAAVRALRMPETSKISVTGSEFRSASSPALKGDDVLTHATRLLQYVRRYSAHGFPFESILTGRSGDRNWDDEAACDLRSRSQCKFAFPIGMQFSAYLPDSLDLDSRTCSGEEGKKEIGCSKAI